MLLEQILLDGLVCGVTFLGQGVVGLDIELLFLCGYLLVLPYDL